MKLNRLMILCAVFSVLSAQAQWTTQTYDLQPGWNAIYLSLQPVPAECSDVFAGLPVESVSWWSRVPGGAEFDSDPSDLFPRIPNWHKWTPKHQKARSFGSLMAGESYLVNLNTNVSVQLTIRGTAVLVPLQWIHNEYNLMGFPVSQQNTATFEQFFSFTDKIGIQASDGGDIQTVETDNSTLQLFAPSRREIETGKAYWVKCGPHATDYAGPLRVSLGSSAKQMDFSGSFTPQTLRIKNETDAVRNVTIRHAESDIPPVDQVPLAEKTPLLMAQMNWNPTNLGIEYVEFPLEIFTNVAPGQTLEIKLMPEIAELGSAPQGSAWQSILEVSDEGNEVGSPVMLQRVGVYCEVPEADVFDPAGLWVGAVSVDKVSRAPAMTGPSNVWDSTVPVSVTRPYTFRVLIHVNDEGESKLLQSVYPAWIPDGEIVHTEIGSYTNGTQRLYTKLSDAPDNAQLARISSSNFPLIDPLLMHETSSSTSLVFFVELPFNNPVNPFVHPYHPMHDNKEFRNGEQVQPPGEGVESYTVKRLLAFSFEDTDSVRAGNPNWGIKERGGTYMETVTGLNKTIYTSGQFRLEKVSDCKTLDGN